MWVKQGTKVLENVRKKENHTIKLKLRPYNQTKIKTGDDISEFNLRVVNGILVQIRVSIALCSRIKKITEKRAT